MFTFAMIAGVRHGWLPEETYGPAARKAWLAVAGFVDQNADVTNVCVGTNKQNSYDYYMARPRRQFRLRLRQRRNDYGKGKRKRQRED